MTINILRRDRYVMNCDINLELSISFKSLPGYVYDLVVCLVPMRRRLCCCYYYAITTSRGYV